MSISKSNNNVDGELPALDCMIFYVRPMVKGSILEYPSFIRKEKGLVLDSSLLIAPSLDDLNQISGVWNISGIPIFSAIEILATLDEAKSQSNKGKRPPSDSEIKFEDSVPVWYDRNYSTWRNSEVSGLLISEVMNGGGYYLSLLNILRRYEAYGIFRYFISQSANGENIKISQLSKNYGLSSPYFRFLCRKSFNSSAKKKMMSWRMATAVLLLIESDMSILDVGLACGYCSASHFTLDIKRNFGLTPSEIRHLESGLYDS